MFPEINLRKSGVFVELQGSRLTCGNPVARAAVGLEEILWSSANMKKSSGAKKRSTRKAATRGRARSSGSARRLATKRAKRGGRKWSRKVTERSDALDLRKGVFKLNDPKKIAASLKRSAERSKRRKANPYRSAQSMLTFYINRAGKDLPASRKRTLERAKDELRRQFGRA
jgi:hypothetical protein